MSSTLFESVGPTVTNLGSSWPIWTGRVLTGAAVAFLLMDVSMKLLRVDAAVQATVQLGFTQTVVFPLGLVQLACLLLYMIPQTAPFGAALMTAYLGGAVAIHVQRANPILSHTLVPVYVAIMLWGGLFLRDARVRNLFAQA